VNTLEVPVRVSVVIPVRNAAATLGEQLQALAEQRGASAWEVIVADNGSTDATVQVAESYRRRLPALTVVDASQRSGAAHARNRGAEVARGEVILFCDADDVVADHWVAAMSHGVEERGFVASRFEVELLNSPAVAAAHRHPQETGLNPYTYPDFLPHAGGAGLGVQRALHEEIGGFDESRSALEDTDYCWRLQLAGHPLSFAGDAVVHVRFKEDLGGDFRQLFSYGVNNVRIYRDYRTRGMKSLSPVAGPLRWAKLLLTAPRLLFATTRAGWVGQLGWRLGRVAGCLRYVVWAP
jgi:glycosyltransferase involved in cell wall biosynthesis